MQNWDRNNAGPDGRLAFLDFALRVRRSTSAYARKLDRTQTPHIINDIQGTWSLPLGFKPLNVLATFNVKQKDSDGLPAEGGEVQLIWLASPNAAPDHIGRTVVGSTGRVTVRGAISRIQQQTGNFKAVVTYLGETSTYSLPRFPAVSTFSIYTRNIQLDGDSHSKATGSSKPVPKELRNFLAMKLTLIPAGRISDG